LTSEQRQQAAVEDMLAWLEDGLRETRAHLLKMEQGLSAAEGHITELTGKVHAAEDGSATVSRRFSEITPVVGQLALVHQSLTQAEEQVRESERRLSEALRVQQQESERQRQELNGAVRRIDLLERTAAGFGPRFENLEGTIGRLQEALTLARQRTEELSRRQEDAELHAARSVEAMKRYEHQIGRLELGLEESEKTRGQLSDRLQAFGESVKRLEEHIDTVAADVSGQRDIFERIDLLRAELHRLEDRIASTQTDREGDRQEIEDHQRLIGLLDGKNHGFTERLSMLQGELAAYRELVAEQFNRLHLTLDRQKRHQVEELQRELRDLQVNAFRPAEELLPEENA
jgi:chromosome segregation ATPase